jgi:hypothetical protein
MPRTRKAAATAAIAATARMIRRMGDIGVVLYPLRQLNLLEFGLI